MGLLTQQKILTEPTLSVSYPSGVTGGSYMEKLGYINSFEMFPYPPEVTGGAYLNNVQLIGRTTAVSVPFRGNWGFLLCYK